MEILESVTSTMDVARERIVAGHIRFDPSGHTTPAGIMALRQTQGRGQRGREWHSEPGESLHATYYVPCGNSMTEIAGKLSLWAGVSVAEVLASLISDLCPVGLKWPNDLMLRNKKVGGILIEMARSSGDGWVALVGVGINLGAHSVPPHLLATGTSLEAEGVTAPTWREIGEAIAVRFQDAARSLPQLSLREIVEQWRRRDQTQGRTFEASVQGERIRGIAIGVDDSGALKLEKQDGTMVLVASASTVAECSNGPAP